MSSFTREFEERHATAQDNIDFYRTELLTNRQQYDRRFCLQALNFWKRERRFTLTALRERERQ